MTNNHPSREHDHCDECGTELTEDEEAVHRHPVLRGVKACYGYEVACRLYSDAVQLASIARPAARLSALAEWRGGCASGEYGARVAARGDLEVLYSSLCAVLEDFSGLDDDEAEEVRA